jgi:mannose-1-phosphate guanylyltransferase
MQAIILAGGFGTRLAPLTYTRAKSMLPLMNKPMIRHLVDQLPKNTEIIIASNYKNEQIQEYFDTQGIPVIINNEPKPLGTGGAVKYASKYLNEPFLVLNSDIISSLDIETFIQYHHKLKAYATISLWPVENVEEFGVVDIRDDNKIITFVEKPPRDEAPSNLINAGAYYLDYSILDYIRPGKMISMEAEIFPKILEDNKPFYGFKFSGYWIDVGRFSSYFEATSKLLATTGVNYLAGDSIIKGTVFQSVIGDNCTLKKDSIVHKSIIYDNCSIGRSSEIYNCILSDNCTIADSVMLRNCVIGENEVIASHKKIETELVWTKPIPSNYPKKQIGNPLKKTSN